MLKHIGLQLSKKWPSSFYGMRLRKCRENKVTFYDSFHFIMWRKCRFSFPVDEIDGKMKNVVIHSRLKFTPYQSFRKQNEEKKN